MQRAYSPQVLRVLDALRLTDVFHAWWFVLLLSLVRPQHYRRFGSAFPQCLEIFSRPYKSPDESFRNALPLHKLIPV